MTSRSRRRQNEDLMDVDEDGRLSENYQTLLQFLLHTRMVKKLQLSKIHGKLFNDTESLSDSLRAISSIINSSKMDIKSVVCDITGETYYVVIHTAGESFFPKSCIFNQSQLEFLKQVLTGIILSENGTITKIQALNSCKTLSKSDADDTIRQFIREKLLIDVNGGQVCLSPLSVVEFEPFFRASCGDNLCSCDLCKQLVFSGKICQGCDNKFHHHCVKKWISSKRSQCPHCSQTWGDEMLTETE